MKKILIFLALGAFFIPSMVFSEESAVVIPIPHLINYQGMLTDNSGNPLTGSFDITFKIFNDASAGTKRWEETQSGVTVTNGLFNVILGSVTPIDLDFTENYWLDITVGAEHMPSRLRFVSVGFAYRAWKADTANYASSVSGGSHNHDASYVNVTGPDSIRSTGSGVDVFKVKSYGSGDADGIEIFTWGTSADGIFIDTAGGDGIEMQDIGDHGVTMYDIHDDGVHMYDVDNYGIYMDDIHDDGIHMTDVDSSGIYMEDVGNNGLQIKNTGDYGVYLERTSKNSIRIDTTEGAYHSIWIRMAGGDGIYIDSAKGEGLEIKGAAGYGIDVRGDNGNIVISSDANYYGLYVHSKDNATHGKGLYVYGDIKCSGTVFEGASPTSGFTTPGGFVRTYGIQSQKNEFMISGTGHLTNGVVNVTFDHDFSEGVSSDAPLKVIVTPTSECNGVFIANKSTTGFTVKELLGGTSNAEFDWIAIGPLKQRVVEEMYAPEELEEELIDEEGKDSRQNFEK